MMQAVAANDVASIAEAWEVVRRSFPVDEHTPKNTAAWDEAYARFSKTAVNSEQTTMDRQTPASRAVSA